jgi:hypothetical protein
MRQLIIITINYYLVIFEREKEPQNESMKNKLIF